MAELAVETQLLNCDWLFLKQPVQATFYALESRSTSIKSSQLILGILY